MVTECGVGDIYVLGHIHRHMAVVICYLGHLGIGEHITEKLGALHLLQLILIGIEIKQIGAAAETYLGHCVVHIGSSFVQLSCVLYCMFVLMYHCIQLYTHKHHVSICVIKQIGTANQRHYIFSAHIRFSSAQKRDSSIALIMKHAAFPRHKQGKSGRIYIYIYKIVSFHPEFIRKVTRSAPVTDIRAGSFKVIRIVLSC